MESQFDTQHRKNINAAYLNMFITAESADAIYSTPKNSKFSEGMI